jgi:hypothetical protein
MALSTVAQPDGYVEVPSRTSAFDRAIGCPQLINGPYDAEAIAGIRSIENCRKYLPADGSDVKDRTLVRWSAGSDCHMRVAIKVFRVDAERRYRVILNNIYGGCRAGGWRSGWVTFDKIPQGYSVELIEIKVDRFHRGDDESEFKFVSDDS